MTSCRRMMYDDLFYYNNLNLDELTETYDLDWYSKYMVYWPDMQYVVESMNSGRNVIIGYLVSKAEGSKEKWHGHVSAVTITPKFRRLGFGTKLMRLCHYVSDKTYNTYFVDLFVRSSNEIGVSIYRKLGYVIYRRILGYYSGVEDAFDMRIGLPRDRGKKSCIPMDRDVQVEEIEFN